MNQKTLTHQCCREYLEETIFGTTSFPNPEVWEKEIGLLGIELEIFPFKISEGLPVPIRIQDETIKLLDILINASATIAGKAIYEEEGKNKNLLKKIEFPNGDNFQFEPGGQIEICINPCKNLRELEGRIKAKQNLLSKITSEYGIHFAQYGTNPWFGTEDLGLQIPKQRYLNLQNYLDAISPFGRKMMRLTGSLQVNLDLGRDEDTRIKRIVAANLLSPFATAIFANSPVAAGKINGFKSYRSNIWQQLDPKRTGLLPLEKIIKSWKKEDVVGEYLKFALNAPLIYIGENPEHILASEYTFDHWLQHPINDHSPKITDFINHLSLLFPEVRLRKYLEIRSVDAPPKEWQMLPVYFYTGLLYSNLVLDKTLKLLMPKQENIKQMLTESVNGFINDDLYHLSREVMKLAIEGFLGLPSKFKDKTQVESMVSFYEKYTSKRRCFADDSIEFFNKNNYIKC
ncbi:glutamate-cysteine ligase family protein [Gillisia limnaea]|uniref:Glutamate--cysteine ligase n=1 Tax=Gillisia limnaea (strain DSM 15749 / LMG 21470 / R-8282) TaxID=865937 RepID=H2BSY7_GILLR|nr:glutamate-cysteine ligase family protein [Gillisia limnaea]EHQ01517.1 glutamate--cysteine ligase GCS2 [Gillisia limnaea DSM 15749]